MKQIKIIFLLFFTISFGFLEAKTKMISENNTRSAIVDAISILSYWSLFSEAHQKYLDTHDHELSVSCKSCKKEFIDLGKFEGGLLGKGLKDLLEGKDNYKETKVLLDTYLKLLSSSSDNEILTFMAQTLSDQQYVCYNCKGISWEPKVT